MSENEVKYLSREEAIQFVAAIQEEEDIDRENHRILTVYNHDNKELCWFDYEEVMEAVVAEGKTKAKSDVQDYILCRIPEWVKEL